MRVKEKLFSFVCIVLISLRLADTKWNSNKFDEKMSALTKTLEYMKDRPQQMNADTTFGVTFAEANLQITLQHKNIIHLNGYKKDYLKKLQILSQRTRHILYESEKSYGDFLRLSASLNRPEIWIRPIVWRKMTLDKTYKPNPNLTETDLKNSMFMGRPQEEESDSCLLDLVDKCQLSDFCREIVVSKNSSETGYPLTHRLLIKQTITALQCNTSISRFLPYLGFNLCSSILQNLINIESLGFPDLGKDLALEQIFLCGMEGFLDFLTKHYEQLVLDWQHFSGCYQGFIDHQRRKRDGNFTDYDCINHTTGLAAAVLSLMIRKDIETLKVK